MTYFHGRPSTIIGAKAFHGPVRDGKGWFHLAMVVKRVKRCGRGARPRPGIRKQHTEGLWGVVWCGVVSDLGVSGTRGAPGMALPQGCVAGHYDTSCP